VVPPDSDRVSRVRSYSGTRSAGQCAFVYGTIALCGARFHSLRLTPDLVTAAGSDTIRTRVLQPQTGNACPLAPARFRLIPFRSPLLGESRLISFPRATEMFHFARLPSPCLCVQHGMTPHYQRRVCPFGNPRIRGCSAPTRGLSQPSTPFVGSWCQGIHHLPLLS
jgi:hypothetical protein